DVIGNTGIKATAQLSLGSILEKQAKYQKALEYYEQALEIKTKTGDKMGEVYCCTTLSRFWADICDDKRAEEYADRAKDIVDKAGYQPQLCWVYSCYARVYSRRNDWENCEKMCQKSLELANQLRYTAFTALVYSDLAFVS
ncbi:MAG: tetratricopeptide repeat protein, partial [Patescibacteria group bacterium]